MNIFVHKGLFIRKEDQSENEQSTETREIGNVTKESTITFEVMSRLFFLIKSSMV